MNEVATAKSPFANPWVQLIIGVICMACVANLQYGWTLFVNPIDAKYHWGRASIQVAFTLFVLIETWLMSCRVLGRQVEPAALEVLAAEAHRQGAKSLIGEYRPTPRNGLVADHYSKLGFTPCPSPSDTAEGSFWRYDIETGPRSTHFIQVESRT